MKETRCYEADDLKRAMIFVLNQRRPQNDKEKWTFQQQYLRLLEESPKIWKDFVQKHQQIYERLGYLDVIIYDDLTIERKKLKRGRPKESMTKSHRITIRLEDELYQLLKEYCQTRNITESEAIRELIRTQLANI